MEFWNDAAEECLSNNPPLPQLITPFLPAHPAYTVALGNLLGIEGAEDTTPLFLKATRAPGSRTARNRPVTQGAVCIGEDYD